MKDITHLYFGKAAAESEVSSNPGRFLDTYLDRWDLCSVIESHEKFLVLGPKGTGKSAAAYFVQLMWKKTLTRLTLTNSIELKARCSSSIRSSSLKS